MELLLMQIIVLVMGLIGVTWIKVWPKGKVISKPSSKWRRITKAPELEEENTRDFRLLTEKGKKRRKQTEQKRITSLCLLKGVKKRNRGLKRPLIAVGKELTTFEN